MNNRRLVKLSFWGTMLLLVAQACTSGTKPADHDHDMVMHDKVMPAPADNGVEKAICVLQPTEGNTVSGTVTFTKTDGGVVVKAEVSGLTPGKHGFHIHQFGDLTAPDGTSAGGHFNPEGHDHGAPTGEMRHVGDLGNLEANAEGVAIYEVTYPSMTFAGPESILGRGIIVHADEDDLVSQPTGAAGARVAIGVIGVAKQ
ncbi:superoxide dismutase family protein [Mangrovibacterium diazotrophicum]|uniref:Cu-Zn family superoxide dismutase n=1 Tax=Mangrovibacterium diazotrophicum TaxID=1261403 RepID=A0A419W6M5_9BACT|nr:superoxide dismutase family protein [Mangrovibacterium diazotrophicum]RKD91080.1 Cu-Zn family superoxide dismutase [Mangrovibacterium diazotrophicum]